MEIRSLLANRPLNTIPNTLEISELKQYEIFLHKVKPSVLTWPLHQIRKQGEVFSSYHLIMVDSRLPLCACCSVPIGDEQENHEAIDPVEIDWRDLNDRHQVNILEEQGSVKSTRIALLQLLEKRDPITAVHSCNMVKLWDALMQSDVLKDAGYRVSADDTRLMRDGLLLHDVGKLAVPEEILFKAGKPTRAELLILRTHIAVREAIKRIGINERLVLNIITRHHAPRFAEDPSLELEAYLTIAKVIDIIEAMNSFLRTYQAPDKTVVWTREEGKVWSIEHEVELSCPENPEFAKTVLLFFRDNWEQICPRLVLRASQLSPAASKRWGKICSQYPYEPGLEQRGKYPDQNNP